MNIIWLALNAMGSIKIELGWAAYYSPIGWGLLVIVHYWFFVRGADNLCRVREEKVEAQIS